MAQRAKWGVVVIVLAACVGVAACSSSDDASKESSSTTAEPSTSTSASTTPPVNEGPSTSGPPATAGDGAAVGVNVLDPVEVGRFEDLGGGVTTTVTSWKEVDATAEVPGDVAGPGIAVTVELRNGSDAPIDASSLVVGALAEGATAPPNSGPPSDPLEGTLAPGDEARGVYVFRVPEQGVEDVVVDIQTGFSPNTVRVRL